MPKAPDRSQPQQTTPRSESEADQIVWDDALDWLLLIEGSPGDQSLRGALEQWLSLGEAQRAAYARAQKVWRLTGHVRADSIPPGRPLPQASRSARSRARLAPRWIAAAAVAAGLLLAGLPYLRVQILADYQTGVGETRRVALPDGSTVTLDSDSAIDLGGALVDKTGAGEAGDRTVSLLAGRAFFEIKHDDTMPFAAKAEDVTVEVHGTAFDLGLTEAGISVALARGAVSLTGPDGASTHLRPGDRAIFDRNRKDWRIERVMAEDIAAWRAGKLVVRNATVADVVAELGRYHTGLILLQDPALAARQVTGVFDLHDPTGALRALLQPFGGRITAITPYLLIVEGA